MSQSSSAPLVRIPAPGPNQAPLTRTQQTFNSLTQQLDGLNEQIVQPRATLTSLHQRLQTEYLPLLRNYYQLRTTLVRVLDRAHNRPDTSRAEQRKLANLIREMTYELLTEQGVDTLQDIADRYNVTGYDTDEPPAFQGADEPTAPQPEAKAGQPPKHDSPPRPKSARKQALEAKRELDARNITKAVRTLYMDLVKAFHPDREPDESEKERKTGIIQRVISTYESGDLLALLRLQLEFERIDQQHLERVADEQIRYYNTILKRQVAELGRELLDLQRQTAAVLGKSVPVVSAAAAEADFTSDLRALKRSVAELKKDVRALNDPATLKAWLKHV